MRAMSIMTSRTVFVPALLALVLGFTVFARAAEDSGKGRKASAKTVEKYDADHDGTLSDAERAKWEADIAAKAKETRERNLAKYDTNKDGKIDEQEREKRRETERLEKEAHQAERDAKKGRKSDGG